MSFNHTRHVKRTRGFKRCDWCLEKINPGDPSVVVSGIHDGDFFTARYHPECDAAIPRFVRKYSDWSEPLPEERMNRGGIEPYGEEEKP
jgi:hypothetical protein